MLITCPECELMISDKALSCPHCGYPLKPSVKRQYNKSHRRLPNGFGQITEIRGRNLRKPFRAMVTVGKNSKGRPICRILKPEGYFESYNAAYTALVEYNRNPYDLSDDITVLQLYERWSEPYFEGLKSESSKRTITSAWSYCRSVYDMRAKDLRARHIKGCMENGEIERKGKKYNPTPGVQSRIKSLFNLMLDYAVEYEIVDKNYARTFEISDNITNEIEKSRKGHMSFRDWEMEILWNNKNVPYVDIILIQCYMGWRPQELGLIKLEDVNLVENIIKGGMKTEAGTGRIVPIHSCIRDFIQKYYKQAIKLDSEYLFNCTDSATHKESIKLTYDRYAYRFNKIRDLLELNPEHRAHDPRKHFATMSKKYNLDEYAIKYIMGHEISDITEKIYTDRDIQWLKDEIAKIKGNV